MIKNEITETKKTRQDRGGNRTKSFAETMECSFCPSLGWLRRDKQGDLLYKVYYEGDGDLLFFPPCGSVLLCAIENSPQFKDSQISSAVRAPIRAEFQKGNSFWCFAYVQVHASGSEFQRTLPMLPSLGIVVNTQESFMRQHLFCCRTEGCFPKLTAVSIVLNMLHVCVRKQSPVISSYKRFPRAVSVVSFCQTVRLFCRVPVTSPPMYFLC